jgi:hypothetical protein
MEFLGKTPNGLSASATLPAADGQCEYYFDELPNQSPKTQLGLFFLVRCFKSTARRSSRHAHPGDFLSMMEEAMSITAIAFVLIILLVRFRFDPTR